SAYDWTRVTGGKVGELLRDGRRNVVLVAGKPDCPISNVRVRMLQQFQCQLIIDSRRDVERPESFQREPIIDSLRCHFAKSIDNARIATPSQLGASTVCIP